MRLLNLTNIIVQHGVLERNTEKKYDLMIWYLKPGGAGVGDSHMKGVGMLVVSLSSVNFGFWCHLGYSGKKAVIFSREGLV